MKKTPIFIFLILLSMFSFSQETKLPPSRIQAKVANFRGAEWGMSKKQIKNIEKSEFLKSGHSEISGLDVLGYKGKAGAFDCGIAYYFAENQLVEGRYVFLVNHYDKNLYISDFKEIKNNLIEKYGAPKEDTIFWRNKLYKDKPEAWGFAISLGHLEYETIWDFPDTRIALQLFGDDHKITHLLDYKSNSEFHKKLVAEAEKKAKEMIW